MVVVQSSIPLRCRFSSSIVQKLFTMNIISIFVCDIITLLLIYNNRAKGIVGYTRRPLNGYFCNTGQYTVVGQLDQLACTRSCIISASCMFLMHHPKNKTCLHLQGSQPCHLATPDPEIMIMRLRPSLQEQCLIPSSQSNDRLIRTSTGHTRMLSRKYGYGIICLGLSLPIGYFLFAGPDVTTVCPDVPADIMAVHPSCTVAWVTHTAGEVLPRGVIVMGYWHGKPSFSTRHNDGLEQSFGLYVEGNDMATYNFHGRQTPIIFEILISV